MIKKFALAVAAFIILPLFSGCLKPVSLDAYGYVICIGLDKGENGGVYYTLALQRELAEQNTESEGGAILLADSGSSIFEAMNRMEGSVPYSLNFSRADFLIISRELAEEGGLESFLEISLDALKIRPSAAVIVSECTAQRFIGGMYANNDANINKLQNALMMDREKTGMVTVASLSRLMEAAAEGRFDFCSAMGNYDESIITDMSQKRSEAEGEDPLKDAETGMRIGGLKALMTGAALFSGFEMTGSLTREETMLLNMITGEFENGTMTVKLAGRGRITVFLSLVKSKKKAAITPDGSVSAAAFLELSCGMRMDGTDMSPDEAYEWMKNELPLRMEQKLAAVFYKCRAAGSDAMRFGTELSKRFCSLSEWEAFGWKERYPLLEPAFFVTVVNAEKPSYPGMSTGGRGR